MFCPEVVQTFEEIGNVLQLRNIVRPESAVLLKQGENVIELLAGVSWVERHKFLNN